MKAIEDMGTLELIKTLKEYYLEHPEEARKLKEWIERGSIHA